MPEAIITDKRKKVTSPLDVIEQHYTVEQLAKRLQLNYSTVLRIAKLEPGVVQIGNLRSRKRTRITIRIPESVARRIVDRLTLQKDG